MVAAPDTIGKTMERIAHLALSSVVFKGRLLNPEPLSKVVVGESMFRTFTCARGCRSCCLIDCTLDYIPIEEHWSTKRIAGIEMFQEREVEVNGASKLVFTRFDKVTADPNSRCPYLQLLEDGKSGCTIWPNNPLECSASPTMHIRGRQVDGKPVTYLTKQPFSRAWRYPEHMECDFAKPLTLEELDVHLGLFKRYDCWASYFGILTVIPDLIYYFEQIKYGKQEAHRFEFNVG